MQAYSRNRKAPSHALTWLLALVLALGPIGAYTHGLQHLPFPGPSPGALAGDPGVGHGPSVPEDGRSCELFGAHAPLGAAAPVQGWLAPLFVPPPAAVPGSVPGPVHRGAEYRPHHPRAPPPLLLLA